MYSVTGVTLMLLCSRWWSYTCCYQRVGQWLMQNLSHREGSLHSQGLGQQRGAVLAPALLHGRAAAIPKPPKAHTEVKSPHGDPQKCLLVKWGLHWPLLEPLALGVSGPGGRLSQAQRHQAAGTTTELWGQALPLDRSTEEKG